MKTVITSLPWTLSITVYIFKLSGIAGIPLMNSSLDPDLAISRLHQELGILLAIRAPCQWETERE